MTGNRKNLENEDLYKVQLSLKQWDLFTQYYIQEIPADIYCLSVTFNIILVQIGIAPNSLNVTVMIISPYSFMILISLCYSCHSKKKMSASACLQDLTYIYGHAKADNSLYIYIYMLNSFTNEANPAEITVLLLSILKEGDVS